MWSCSNGIMTGFHSSTSEIAVAADVLSSGPCVLFRCAWRFFKHGTNVHLDLVWRIIKGSKVKIAGMSIEECQEFACFLNILSPFSAATLII